MTFDFLLNQLKICQFPTKTLKTYWFLVATGNVDRINPASILVLSNLSLLVVVKLAIGCNAQYSTPAMECFLFTTNTSGENKTLT